MGLRKRVRELEERMLKAGLHAAEENRRLREMAACDHEWKFWAWKRRPGPTGYVVIGGVWTIETQPEQHLIEYRCDCGAKKTVPISKLSGEQKAEAAEAMGLAPEIWMGEFTVVLEDGVWAIPDKPKRKKKRAKGTKKTKARKHS